jgi:hypothetical protein
MKKSLFLFASILFFGIANSQNPGDTIVVKAFKYGSSTRDTLIQFPNNNLTYEKIIMKYNMRCKNGLVSNSNQPNLGCGEWDYSCNTFVVDSTRIEQNLNTAPSHIISNFTGTTFPYSNAPVFDYYNFLQTNVTLSSVVSETSTAIGTGTMAAPDILKSNERSGKTQILVTAAELTAAGFTAGNIDALLLNVANAGGGVNFFRVDVQHTLVSALSNTALTLTGFTNVYNQNYSFANGNNRIQFHSPFAWNGTDNLILQLSFTNTNPSNPIVFTGHTSVSNPCLFARNNYALDLSYNGHVVLNASALSAISTELTIGFWAYGDANLLPTNTSLLYGWGTNPNQRNLNLHHPWSNSNMYFDCGYSVGNYDRINKLASASEIAGQWNHWAFTKNTATGVMNIYLNGALWHTGTAKTKPIALMNLILGKDNNYLNNYKGKVNELCIFNKALAQADIQAWMNRSITPSHPNFANLLSYFKLNEGSGTSVTDAQNALTSPGTNLRWTYDRGLQLNRMFETSNVRPNISFLRGTYSMSTGTVIVKDSVIRPLTIISSYSITNNATVVPMAHDVVSLVTTTTAYSAAPVKIYDGDTGALTGTMAAVAQGTINISQLNYIRRFPFYNEIMSFVTPYGLGLNMGINGKTWFFDVSDFEPLLKGPKRFVMGMGGENQEQMDIDFWFIVGTPPRTVLNFNQLWQGAYRDGGAGINSVVNDIRFPILSVPTQSNAQQFKLRSTITGHGAEGEFQQNGGPITHFFNVNGGPNEFSWSANEECSFNVIYPQGGTWVYDRQGWCPGQASLTKMLDLTPHITPGNTVTLDYSCSNPQFVNGDYRYLVAHQMVSYGGPNHALDAAIEDVISPSTKVLYSRRNPICNNPIIVVRNTGNTIINDLEIHYWVNNASVKQTHYWSGSLAFMDTLSIELPKQLLWLNGVQQSGNVFHAEIVKVNTVADQYPQNNSFRSAFVIPETIPSLFSVEFRTNNLPTHQTYKIFDESGNVVGQSNFTAANTTYLDNYELNGCYTFVVQDIGQDGLSWWANTSQGSGFVRFKNASGQIIKSFNADFGGGFQFNFTTDSPLSIEKQGSLAAAINVYPNPASERFVVDGNLEGAEVFVVDVLGKRVHVPYTSSKNRIEFNSSELKPGMYFIQITKGDDTAVKKIVVQ